jgi:hypothetical protein
MMKIKKQYLVIVKADTNDGDYISDTKEYGEAEYLEIKERLARILPIVKKQGGKWEKSEMGNSASEYVRKRLLTEEDADWFDDFTPNGEYGIHTVESVTVYEIVGKQELL